MQSNNTFTFEISLSVLNHLGRNLYRSFATVLGEAISNSWDADAKNVRIYIDKKKDSFFIKDDGTGMTADDFQNKFLKIVKKNDSSFKEMQGLGKVPLGRLLEFGQRSLQGFLQMPSCQEIWLGTKLGAP